MNDSWHRPHDAVGELKRKPAAAGAEEEMRELRIDEITRVTVVGSGQMGSQIGMLCALSGYDTVLVDIDPAVLTRTQRELAARMNQWVAKKKLTATEKDAAMARLTMSSSLQSAVGETDLVIESVVEKLALKREIFAQLDHWAPSHAILATNSSTIVSSQLASHTARPDKVLNLHFFFPPLTAQCVEVVVNPNTSEATAHAALEFCHRIGRVGVLIRNEIPGFVANRILGAMEREAMALYEAGIADFHDIDLICRQAFHHPMGPFEIMDLSGNDVTYLAMQQIYEDTGDRDWKPCGSLVEKVKEGQLGRKTGIGWYTYPREDKK